MQVFKKKINKSEVMDILKKELGEFDPKEYVIVYKASLVLRDLVNECNDIDVEISENIAKVLSDRLIPFTIASSGDHRYQLGERLECFYSGGGRHVKKTDIVNGFQCVDYKECVETYRKRNRPKDQETLLRLGEVIDNG